MKKLLTLIVSVLPAVFLNGCSVLPNKNAPENIVVNEVKQDFGLIVISTGADTGCFSEASWLKVIPSDKTYSDEEALIDVDSALFESDFTTHQGFLNVVSLKAGNYYLANQIANPYVEAKKVPKFSFTVTPSKVTYLGEYYLTVSCSNSFVIGEFRNMYDRDIKLLKIGNLEVSEMEIDIDIPQFSGYAINDNE